MDSKTSLAALLGIVAIVGIWLALTGRFAKIIQAVQNSNAPASTDATNGPAGSPQTPTPSDNGKPAIQNSSSGSYGAVKVTDAATVLPISNGISLQLTGLPQAINLGANVGGNVIPDPVGTAQVQA